MNRHDILDCIQRHLASQPPDASGQSVLGDIVFSVGQELRRLSSSTHSATNNYRPTPVQLVAAFVDGELSTEEEQLVCRSALEDNSVLSEIIASVKASQSKTIEPLSDELSSRLMAIVSANWDQEIDILPPAQVVLAKPINQPRRWSAFAGWGVGLATIAAVLVLLFYSTNRSEKRDENLAQDDSTSLDTIPRPDEGSHNSIIVDDPQNMQASDQNSLPDSSIEIPLPETPKSVKSHVPDLKSMTASDSSEATNITNNSRMPPLETLPTDERKIELKWTKIQGILASKQSTVQENSESHYEPWSGTEPGNSTSLQAQPNLVTSFQTLSMTRAEGIFISGGKLVIAPDSYLTFSHDEEVEGEQVSIRHGAVAFVDMPVETKISPAIGGHKLPSIRWHSKGTLVLAATSQGILARIEGGTIEVEGLKYKNTQLLIADTVTEQRTRTKMPIWVTRPIESIKLPKSVLTQLAASDDVFGAIDRLAQAPSNILDANAVLVLNDLKLRMDSRPIAELLLDPQLRFRLRALEKLSLLPTWSNDWRKFWAQSAEFSGDPQKARLLSNCIASVRSGSKLASSQIDAIVSSLESQDSATRSIADAVLRQLYNGGPNYDPLPVTSSTVRAVGIWRRYVAANPLP